MTYLMVDVLSVDSAMSRLTVSVDQNPRPEVCITQYGTERLTALEAEKLAKEILDAAKKARQLAAKPAKLGDL